MPNVFDYHVFISYSSADAPWAQMLFNELHARGVTSFLDKERLVKGEEWEPQLIANLKGSRHLVLLWSKNADDSDWVDQEVNRFRAIVDPDGTGLIENRRIFVVYLEGEKKTLGKFHGYTRLRDDQAYPTKVNDPQTKAAIAEIADDLAPTVLQKDDMVNVPRIVRAMTKPLIAAAAGPVINVPQAVPETLDDFLGKLGFDSLADLTDRYGDHPDEWRPFGTNESIKSILNNALNDKQSGLNRRLTDLNGKKIAWASHDLITPSFADFKRAVEAMPAGALVLVIDPISLCNDKIRDRYLAVERWFQNRQTIAVVVLPFRPNEAMAYLRTWLNQRGEPLLNGYYNPPHPNYTDLVFRALDESDITRVMKATLCRNPAIVAPATAAKSALLQMGDQQ